jgi:endoglucanase
MLFRATLIYFCLLLAISTFSQKNIIPIGINLCGSEFGEYKLPGKLNVDYVYPNENEINYFVAKGFKTIDLPFKWERIQKELGGELNEQEVNEIKKFLYTCSKKGIRVILSMHNFGRYRKYNTDFIVGSSIVPKEVYKDVWKKIAIAFKNYSNIYAFDIMSEPHNMWGFSWPNSVQAVIDGIREINKEVTIIVGGDNYSDPSNWPVLNDALKYLYDPSNKILFDAHCYFDKDKSGKYAFDYSLEGAYEKIGIDRIKPFVQWLKQNKKQGIVGEFGVPANDQRWLVAMDKFLNYLSEQNIPANYWAAGSWWYNYPLSIQPINGIDKPQMFILQKYLHNNYYYPTSVDARKLTTSNNTIN